MTLGNMRANGVRSLDVSCWLCHLKDRKFSDGRGAKHAIHVANRCPDKAKRSIIDSHARALLWSSRVLAPAARECRQWRHLAVG
jgi:ssDNA-binding Zn-finger/Zn-ribbon topoisomerase 1